MGLFPQIADQRKPMRYERAHSGTSFIRDLWWPEPEEVTVARWDSPQDPPEGSAFLVDDPKPPDRDKTWPIRFAFGLALGASTVNLSKQLTDNYRASEANLLLAAAVVLAVFMVWRWRGKWRAVGLGLLVVAGAMLLYLIGLLIVVLILIANGTEIS